jgi:hypothetical protein
MIYQSSISIENYQIVIVFCLHHNMHSPIIDSIFEVIMVLFTHALASKQTQNRIDILIKFISLLFLKWCRYDLDAMDICCLIQWHIHKKPLMQEHIQHKSNIKSTVVFCVLLVFAPFSVGQ